MDGPLATFGAGTELSGVLPVLFGPVVDASCAEEIPAASAFLGFADNISADGAVEHISRKVGKQFLVVAVLIHFVDFL